MLAIKIPYPPPETLLRWVEFNDLHSLEKTIDFPDRRLSYLVAGCKEADWQQYTLEVRKAVNLLSPGTEPSRLEIRLSEPN